jgi:hypothetical protein
MQMLRFAQHDSPFFHSFSVILFRLSASHRPDYQLSLLLANLDDLSVDLERGCIVVFEDRRIRVRRLPIGD